MGAITEVTDDTFDSRVLNAAGPVLVDFYADWCKPCKAMIPSLMDLAKEYDGEVEIMKLDVDINKETAARYGVRGIPHFIIFSHGDIVSIPGPATRTKLALAIEAALVDRP